MTLLTVFGAAAVACMLLFYALEHRSTWFILAFAGACLASSAYGFLQGAWPFGVVELIWSGVALRRWQAERSRPTRLSSPPATQPE
jgi:presenilin-like A22 family membrane protease